jgi:hypothetical protein
MSYWAYPPPCAACCPTQGLLLIMNERRHRSFGRIRRAGLHPVILVAVFMGAVGCIGPAPPGRGTADCVGSDTGTVNGPATAILHRCTGAQRSGAAAADGA